MQKDVTEWFALLDLCVSSLRRGHANLRCAAPIAADDPRRECDNVLVRELRLSVDQPGESRPSVTWMGAG